MFQGLQSTAIRDMFAWDIHKRTAKNKPYQSKSCKTSQVRFSNASFVHGSFAYLTDRLVVRLCVCDTCSTDSFGDVWIGSIFCLVRIFYDLLDRFVRTDHTCSLLMYSIAGCPCSSLQPSRLWPSCQDLMVRYCSCQYSFSLPT